MDETLSLEDQWLDILLSRFTDQGCHVSCCLREGEGGAASEHIIYQLPNGRLQHCLFKYNGLQEPTLVINERLFMMCPP
jgi:hypothetical protein